MTEYEYDYCSRLRNYFHAFLDFKASIMHNVPSYAFLFKQIDEFLVSRNYEKTYIDKAIYGDWIGTRISNISPATAYKENSMMRTFLIFTTRMGNECYIPPIRKQPEKAYVPHIFSNAEIEALFNAADRLRLKNRCNHNTLHMIPALLRLLYSTGMRLGEALDLRNRDVDLKACVIRLHKTKNCHERIAPINESLETVLEEYLYNRSRIPTERIECPDGYFFCETSGQKPSFETVRRWFHIARKEAGIQYYGREGGPNVHCLRHTACVHSLLKMVKNGKDPYCCLPTLASFMGHRSINGTEYYIHLSEELYPEIIQLEQKISSGINAVICSAIKQYDHES